MEPQTDSSTPIIGRPDSQDTDFACFVKAKDRGEPTFTLRAQDVSAELVVDVWTLVQLRVQGLVRNGGTIEDAMRDVRTAFGVPDYFPALFEPGSKLHGATLIAEAMRAWKERKVAD